MVRDGAWGGDLFGMKGVAEKRVGECYVEILGN